VCAALLPAAIAVLGAFIALWVWVCRPLFTGDDPWAPEEAARVVFRKRLSSLGPVLVALGLTLVAVVALGGILTCD
jgi:hypothetical protein